MDSLGRVIGSRAKDVEVCGIAYDGKQAVELCDTVKPDIVLMDIRMPVLDGVEATRQILRKNPDVRVMVLTTFDDDEYIREALGAGAYGYLLKNASPEIVVLLSKGFAAKDIADKVCLAEQTVRNYISSIYRKLGVRTRTEIIRLVLNARIPT